MGGIVVSNTSEDGGVRVGGKKALNLILFLKKRYTEERGLTLSGKRAEGKVISQSVVLLSV